MKDGAQSPAAGWLRVATIFVEQLFIEQQFIE
jgi:hypothetical protein